MTREDAEAYRKQAAARYRKTMAKGLQSAAALAVAVAGSDDLSAERGQLMTAASSVLFVVTAEDIAKGRQPEASTLIVAIRGLASHEKSLKPSARRVLDQLRQLLSEVED